MNSSLVDQLTEIAGAENVSVAKTDMITHSYDATQQQFLPDAVVYVRSAQQISKIVKLANRHNIPLLPRGAGSGFTGGSLPIRGGIVLALSRMDKILDIDTENLIAEVEPGVITAQLQKKVEKLGLFYPPTPRQRTSVPLVATSPSVPEGHAVSSTV